MRLLSLLLRYCAAGIRGDRGAQPCHYVTFIDRAFDQLALLRCSVRRELYYLREDELQVLEKFRAPRIVSRGGVEQQAGVGQKSFCPRCELCVHSRVAIAERERGQESFGVGEVPLRGYLIG